MRTIVTFESEAFNSTEHRDYFLNPYCFGDDVARAILEQLALLGVSAETGPEQEDFGWYLDFRVRGLPHRLVLGFRPDREGSGLWIAWLERRTGFLGALLGRRRKGIAPLAPEVIHEALLSLPDVRGLRWHRSQDFDRGEEDWGTRTPSGP